MEKVHRIVLEEGRGEIEEKKSRFLAGVYAVETEEDVQKILEETRKQYWDARHNCYAYILDEGRVMRFSDDGEPGGTAGKPILEVLQGEGMDNCLVVVTRYFGGTLLGTGGLVRAYQQAAKAGLEGSVLGDRMTGISYTIRTDYNDLGKIQYYVGSSDEGVYILDVEYTDKISMRILVVNELKESFCKKIVEITAGKALIEENDSLSFAVVQGKPVLL